MKFGVCIPHYGIPLDVDNLTNMAIKAEEMGFDSVWVTDHIIVPHEIPDRTDIVYRHDMLEPLSLLTHLGAVTKRVNIGTSVIILPYRNPVVLAKAIATADVLSKGRVIFGAAIGWMEGDFKALNAPFADRGVVSDEYLQLLRELWTNPTPNFQGEHFQISDVTFSPMPVQKPHPPIWVGGRSRRGVRRAVRYGDAWYPSQLPPAQVAGVADFEPVGQRGWWQRIAPRYWGLSAQEYYDAADLWPLDPNGNLLLMGIVEEPVGVSNLRDILRQVRGNGAIWAGPGDMSVAMGLRGNAGHPEVQANLLRILETCKEFDVPCATGANTPEQVAMRMDQGFRIIITAPDKSTPGLNEGRRLAGR